MINGASSRLQTNQVIESKNTSFTVTHLVLKIKEVPSKTENGKKNDWTFMMSTFIPTHQRAKVRQRSSLVCSSLPVFSRCNSIFPGVILALLLHGLFSFNCSGLEKSGRLVAICDQKIFLATTSQAAVPVLVFFFAPFCNCSLWRSALATRF